MPSPLRVSAAAAHAARPAWTLRLDRRSDGITASPPHRLCGGNGGGGGVPRGMPARGTVAREFRSTFLSR